MIQTTNKNNRVNPYSQLKNNEIRDTIMNKGISNLNDSDMKLIKKYFLGDRMYKGYYTNEYFANFITDLLYPRYGKVLDPCCGSGRLIDNIHINDLTIHCFEIDRLASDICKKLYGKINIINDNALKYKSLLEGKFDYFICNPPWGLNIYDIGSEKYYYANFEEINEIGNSMAFFLELCLNSLKPNGKGIIILSDSFNSEYYRNVKEHFLLNYRILAEIRFPESIFFSSGILVKGFVYFIEKNPRIIKEFNRYEITEWHINNNQLNEQYLNNLLVKIRHDISMLE